MLLMLRLLMIISLLSSSVWADKIIKKTQELDKKILKFEKRRISKNRSIKLKSLKIFLKKDLKQNDWIGYVFDVGINVNGKDIKVKDILFTNGEMIAPDLINIKNSRSFKKNMYPKLTVEYYDKKHLIAGNENAKHKVVIFSDPLCPICVDTVPEIIKDIQKNPKNIGLYYIHMPLAMHPTAKTLVKASFVAKKQGIKDIDYKVYTANFEEYFDAYEEKDNKKVLGIFNKKFNTNITMKQINSKDIEDEVKHNLKLSDKAMIQGTPTIFFDGEIDIMRNKYKKFLK